MIVLIQKVSNSKKVYNENSHKYTEVKITEKVLKFLKDQRMILYKNRMFNYDEFLSLTRKHIKAIKKNYLKTS